MIEKYIRHLLFNTDCVVIPDFGGFIATYAPATIHPARHTFVPPCKAIAFNEMLRLNDGLLISHVALGEDLTREQATQAVSEFAEHVRLQIRLSQKYTFDEIGTLSLTPERRMEFEPVSRVNYLNDGFGLPELSFQPIERRPYHAPKPRTKDRQPIAQNAQAAGSELVGLLRRNRQLVYTLGLSAIVGISALTGYLVFNTTNQALGSFNPFGALINMPSEEDSTVRETEERLFKNRKPASVSALPVPQPETLVAGAPLVAGVPDVADGEGWGPAAKSIPVENIPVENTVAEPVVPEKEKPKAVLKPETKAENSIPRKAETPATTGAEKAVANTRYYVVVNGFSVEKNAGKFRSQLLAEGMAGAKTLARGANGLIKVSVADYGSRAAAEAKASEMKKQYPAAWVFEN